MLKIVLETSSSEMSKGCFSTSAHLSLWSWQGLVLGDVPLQSFLPSAPTPIPALTDLSSHGAFCSKETGLEIGGKKCTAREIF